MQRIFVYIFLISTFISPIKAFCNEPDDIDQNTAIEVVPLGFNIKVLPAMYWRTLGLEAEFPINETFTVGLSVLGYLGGLDGKNSTQISYNEAYHLPGVAVDAYVRYYFHKEEVYADLARPALGVFVQAHLSYNNLVYFDGNIRPFALHSNWKDVSGVEDFDLLQKPGPIGGGIGVGYQFTIIPKHIVACLMAGSQIGYSKEKLIATVYLAPSIGFMF